MIGGFARFNAAARKFLEADVGPVEDPSTSCAVDACEEPIVNRVPWATMGGDVEYCHYHLARYRHEHPDLWKRLQEVSDEDLTAYATRGNRFLTFEDVPETLFEDGSRAAALLADGNALYLETEPEETGTVRTVNRSLEIQQEREIPLGALQDFLE